MAGIGKLVTNYINNLKFKDKIAEVEDTNNEKASPEASVVIVTYNTEKELLSRNLDSLKKQLNNKFEIIIVDNSDKTDIKSIVSSYSLKYIKLNENYGSCVARNIGIKFARGNIVIFLDDDAIPAPDFVEKHINAYKEYNIFGLRGKAIPVKSSFYNYLAGLYDLGDEVIPCPICLEGNSSFKREVLIEIGGFNPELQGAGGHEGLELTYRFFNKHKDKSKLVYYPKAIIYHDCVNGFYKYIKKTLRSTRHSELITTRFPRIWEFYGGYDLKPKKITIPNFIDRIKLKILQKFTAAILRSRRIIIKIFKIIK